MAMRSGNYYLVVRAGKYSRDLRARLASGLPALAKGEVAIKLSVDVPAAMFLTPQIQAKVIIPENSVSAPVIDATVLDNVREVLEQRTGFDVSVSVVEPGQ
jgi:hypothetical protein